jgi:hypothetical protein
MANDEWRGGAERNKRRHPKRSGGFAKRSRRTSNFSRAEAGGGVTNARKFVTAFFIRRFSPPTNRRLRPRRELARLRGFAKGAGVFSLAGASPGGVGLHYTKGDFVQSLRSAVGTAAARW